VTNSVLIWNDLGNVKIYVDSKSKFYMCRRQVVAFGLRLGFGLGLG